jgi:hypothetical protein
MFPANRTRACCFFLTLAVAAHVAAQPLFAPPGNAQSRWASFENPGMEKGAGGQLNAGGKGAAFKPVKAGETVTLLDTKGAGTVRRMWFTLQDRSPESLRSHVLRMYWEGAAKPAVEVPLGDFFGATLGSMKAYESDLFSSPEGRSLNCLIPMPFRSGARVTFTNESAKDLEQLFYDIDCTLIDKQEGDPLYFHAVWHRESRTVLGKDFELLPRVEGTGRYLGAHIGVIGNPAYTGWWGEGEVKMYLDGDTHSPTIVGTGTEDYIGTAYGQGEFSHRFQGCLLADNTKRMWTFYRHHVPDPVYFHKDIRVTIQQMGGANRKDVLRMVKDGVELTPVTVDGVNFLLDPKRDINDPTLPAEGWTNFYRRDDVCATALFYLDRPENKLPPIAPVATRTADLGTK